MKRRHGLCRSSVYSVWRNMLNRCDGKDPKEIERYKKRGITVDPHWRSFDNFLSDMGLPEPGMTLDRKDNNRGYSKINCRWATRREQARNRRTTRLTEASADLIRHQLQSGVSVSSVARTFNIARSTARRVRDGITWQNMEQ